MNRSGYWKFLRSRRAEARRVPDAHNTYLTGGPATSEGPKAFLRRVITSPNLADDREKFISLLKVDEITGCWHLRTCDALFSYPTFITSRGKVWAGHLWIETLLRGPVPEDLVVDHECEAKTCVNPDHLRRVTQGQNVKNSQARKKEGSS